MNEQADSAPNVKTEDLVETKVVVTEAVQALYEQEKLLIVLNKKTFCIFRAHQIFDMEECVSH